MPGIDPCARPAGSDSPRLAASGWESRADLFRRELVAAQRCTVFLSTGLWNTVQSVKLLARRRGPRWLARDCAKPHLALVSWPGRAASPQISRRAGCSIFASPISSAIANGLLAAKTRQRSFRQASRSCREKIRPDLRHLCIFRFFVLSVRCAVDKQAACHRVVLLGPHSIGHLGRTADAHVDEQGGKASNVVRLFDFLY